MIAAYWRQWLSRSGPALRLGLGLTLVAAVVHLLGLTERYELLVYDWYVRNNSRIPASDEIVHVDIDDDSLERVGSWPWPRDIQAELISTLKELGARQIVVDIVFNDPKPGEARLPVLEPYAELEGQIRQIGEVSPENFIFPDDELAAAVREAGNVYLSMYYEHERPSRPAGEAQLANRLHELLAADFDLGRDELASRVGVDGSRVEAILAGVKRQVAMERVQAILEEKPDAAAREVHERISKRPFDEQTADRADILFACLREGSLQALRMKCPPVPPALKGKLPVAKGGVVPPLAKLTRGSRQDAFVTFQPDPDGRMRRLPLMVEWQGRLLEQLAFAAARDRLGIELEDLSINASGDLIIAARGNRPAMRVPLTEDGRALINWHVEDKWWHSFRHVPVTQLLRVYDCRRRMRENETGRQIRIGEVMRLMRGEVGFAQYRQQVNTLLEQERQIRKAKLDATDGSDAIKALQESAVKLRRQIEADQAETIGFVTEQWQDLQAQTRPAEPDAAADYDRLHQAAALVKGDITDYQRANEAIAAEEQAILRQLRPVVEGKLCFVGYTATAVADMVNTPAYPQMPGVLVHSSLLNSFLQGQFRDWSPRWAQTLAILLLGTLASVLTATRGPRASLVLVAVLLAFLLLVNGGLVFGGMNHWLRLVTAMATIVAVWAVIVVVRYLTVERERRRFSRAVAQYVSPAMARRIAEAARDFDLSPVKGVVTCYFSDLAGFTRLSERLGPEGTRSVLNPYLEAMSVVLHRHNALINKFIGDGIFAFFNPPILPCDRHERDGCAAALESARALSDLKARHKHGELAAEFEQLAMRIGIGAGPVFVGDFGSENKLDYTCMGDTVNLASRLEGANKVFGTSIMVNGAARDGAGDDFAFRPLGRLQVKGQTVAVQVYELLGYSNEVDAESLRFSELFGAAVEAFAQRDWSKAVAEFERCGQLRPGDLGVNFYLATIQRLVDNPPGKDWNGGVELTEK